jgi:hypothetical protein
LKYQPVHARAATLAAPPADVNVVEAGWPQAPAGWRIVASSQAAGWVAWRKA